MFDLYSFNVILSSGNMEWMLDYVDQTDFIVLSGLAVLGSYIYWNYYRQDTPQPLNLNSTSVRTGISSAPKVDRSFYGRMTAEKRQVLILFGSQTGTAEELAGRLAKDFTRYGKKALVMDPEELESEELPKILRKV